MIRAIIFDCFGVLAEDAWLPFKRKYIGDNVELASQVGDLGKQNEYGMMTNDEYFAAEASLIGVDEQLLRDAVGRQVPNTELFEYIRAVLKPRYKIGLLSNANYDVTKELFTPAQAAVFDATVLSCEAKLIKPDQRMFQLIVDRLDVAAEECVFVDDIERYVVAAEEFGMRAVLYTSVDDLKGKLAAYLSLAA